MNFINNKNGKAGEVGLGFFEGIPGPDLIAGPGARLPFSIQWCCQAKLALLGADSFGQLLLRSLLYEKN